MTKDQLISLIKKILGTDVDVKFLGKLDLAELKILVALIRERIESERHQRGYGSSNEMRIFNLSLKMEAIFIGNFLLDCR